jgi:hypothetical protein
MSGLGLNVGGYGSAGANIPVAANMPTGTTINQQAFGIGTSQTAGQGPATAGFGTVWGAVGAAVVLVYLWQTLPR